MIIPKYKNSILNILSSVMKYYRVNNFYESNKILDIKLNKNYKNVILVILDGLSSNTIKKHLTEDSFLRKYLVDDIESVFPSTTTAVMTSIDSGLAPIEHGWLAWELYFKEYGRTIDLYMNKDSYSSEDFYQKDAAKKVLPYKTIYQQIYDKNQDEIEIHSIRPGYFEYFESPNINHKVYSLNETLSSIKEIINNDKRNFISAYWPEPDSTMHIEGPNSDIIKKLLQNIDKELEILSNELHDSIMIISADHGLTEIKKTYYINNYPNLMDCLISAPYMESRAMSFTIHDEMKEYFENEFNRIFKNEFILFSKKEIYEMNLLGLGKPHKKVNDFLGDYLACGISHSNLLYETINGKKRKIFKGEHSGLTSDEMIVPLVIYP